MADRAAEVRAHLDGLRRERAELLRDGAPSDPNAARRYHEQLDDLDNQVEQYEEMLQAAEAQASLDLVAEPPPPPAPLSEAELTAGLRRRLEERRAERAKVLARPVPTDPLGARSHNEELSELDADIESLEGDIAKRDAAAKPPDRDPDRGDLQAADDDAKLAGDLFTGATKPDAPKPKKGCSPPLIATAVIIVIMVIVAGTVVLGGDDEDAASDCPTGEGAVATHDLELIAFRRGCPDEQEDDGGSAASDAAAPPSEDDLPSGAILVQGSSGVDIGCITCDGQSRFLSLEDDVTAVGNGNAQSVATIWEEEGQILEFGARLSAPNLGRYGINFFYTDTFEYGPGVALEIGEQSALYQWTPERDGTVHAGRPVAIIVGEGGTVDEDGVPIPTGEYTLEWWFVFQPD